MKSLIESILSKSGVGFPKNIKKVESIKGQHYFWGVSDYNYSAVTEIDITSSKWTKVVFDDHDWKDIIAYFCPESEWIIYYSKGKSYSRRPVQSFEWAAVSPAKRSKIGIRDFENFYDDILLNGSTIPEFVELDTDLK